MFSSITRYFWDGKTCLNRQISLDVEIRIIIDMFDGHAIDFISNRSCDVTWNKTKRNSLINECINYNVKFKRVKCKHDQPRRVQIISMLEIYYDNWGMLFFLPYVLAWRFFFCFFPFWFVVFLFVCVPTLFFFQVSSIIFVQKKIYCLLTSPIITNIFLTIVEKLAHHFFLQENYIFYIYLSLLPNND